MTYIVTALAIEAKPIIKKLNLKLNLQKPFSLYENETFKLIISGMGKDQALMATTHLLALYPPQSSDLLVNIGIAAARQEHPIGEAFIAHTICDEASGKSFYPDMRLAHPFKELALTTVSQPLDTDRGYEAVDMEASGVFKAGVNYLSTSQIIIYKVISDHFSATIPDKESVSAWIEKDLELLFSHLAHAQEKLPEKLTFSKLLKAEKEKLITALQLTKAQSDQLTDQLKGYILRHKTEPLLPKHLPIQHKKEQKDAFNKLLTLLAS